LPVSRQGGKPHPVVPATGKHFILLGFFRSSARGRICPRLGPGLLGSGTALFSSSAPFFGGHIWRDGFVCRSSLDKKSRGNLTAQPKKGRQTPCVFVL
jgi:hypothetical protein